MLVKSLAIIIVEDGLIAVVDKQRHEMIYPIFAQSRNQIIKGIEFEDNTKRVILTDFQFSSAEEAGGVYIYVVRGYRKIEVIKK